MNNISQALLLDQRSLDLLENNEASDPFFVAQVYMHMGQHYTQQDHFEQAREMFARALAIVEDLSTPDSVQSTYGHICQILADTGQQDLVEKYAHKCLYIAAQQAQNHLRSELYHYLGRAMMTANQEQVGIFLERALTQDSVTRDQLSRASLLTNKAEWYLKQGSLDDAIRKARRAVELAAPFGDSIIHATASITLGTVEYALSDHEGGDQHFTAGLDMLERLGHHEELAEAAVRYAQLLEEYGKAREAFIYFRRAFESQQLQRR
jgi:tetratricopeptide (TPR) repeat protein